jgi:hypothetical protein
MRGVLATLRAAAESAELVRFARHRLEREGAYSRGFVMGVSERLVLLNKVSDSIRLDGFEVTRIADITSATADFEVKPFYLRALEMKGLSPRHPPIDLTTMETAIRSIDAHAPPLVIHREAADPDVAFIGRVTQWLKSGFRMRLITPSAEWVDDDTLYRYAAITRVDFGSEYETTLARVAALDGGESPGGDSASARDADARQVWVFNGNGRFPAAVFSTRANGEAWIRRDRLSGTLTAYPVDEGAYDWAVRTGVFHPKKEKHASPDFIGAFSPAYQDHHHYENGRPAGEEEDEAPRT